MMCFAEYKGQLYNRGMMSLSHVEGCDDQYLSFDNGEKEGYFCIKNPYLASINYESMFFITEDDELLILSPNENSRITQTMQYSQEPHAIRYLEAIRKSFIESRNERR